MARGDRIRASDYNAIRAKVVAVLGTGAAQRGYGQSILSSAVTTNEPGARGGQTITKADWDALRIDLSNIKVHQDGLLPPIITPADRALVGFGAGHPNTNYNTIANQADDARFNISISQALVANLGSRTRTDPWSNQAQCTVTLTFNGGYTVTNGDGTSFIASGSDHARHFFNSGGQIRFNSTRTGGTSSAQNTSWTNLLNSIGTQAFGAISGGGDSSASIRATIDAISFTPNSLTATVTAFSFPNNSVGGLVGMRLAIASNRNYFVIPTSQYDALTTSITTTLGIGDVVDVNRFLISGQRITGVQRNAFFVGSTGFTKITLSSNPNANTDPQRRSDPPGAASQPVRITFSLPTIYQSAVSVTRNDFLIAQTQFATANIIQNNVVNSPRIAISRTITSLTPNYVKIGGILYARVVMNGNATANGTGGAGNDESINVFSAVTTQSSIINFYSLRTTYQTFYQLGSSTPYSNNFYKIEVLANNTGANNSTGTANQITFRITWQDTYEELGSNTPTEVVRIGGPGPVFVPGPGPGDLTPTYPNLFGQGPTGFGTDVVDGELRLTVDELRASGVLIQGGTFNIPPISVVSVSTITAS